MNPIFYADFYKIGHIDMYPKGITRVWSNWTPRTSRVKEVKEVIHFGLQYFLKKVLVEEFNENFFNKDKGTVLWEYREVIKKTLGIANPRTDHIEALHDLGYLPLKIYGLPEGTAVPLGIPSVVIVNTVPDFFWLPNYIETMLSAFLWKPSTSATTARRFREIGEKWADHEEYVDRSYIDYQFHDFSFRGMSGVEDAIISGLGHLTSFQGTDSIPALLAAQKYYRLPLAASSVFASEHSTMCAGTKESELETFERLLDTYPTGILSIVSDTWDLWKVLTEYVPKLKDKILARDGIVVIRPDSSPKTPVEIICGDPEEPVGTPANKGVLRLLAETMGTSCDKSELPVINKMAAIYGDSITPDRAEAILNRTVTELKLSPCNVVMGIGSYSYEYVTRDTYGFAMKATAIEKDNKIIPIFKDPVTDSGVKKSRKGIVSVHRNYVGNLECTEGNDPRKLDNCAFDLVYSNGVVCKTYTMHQIRDRVKGYIK